MKEPNLVCPDCFEPLELAQGFLRCEACDKNYPVIDRVACFKKDRFYWQEEKDELERIIEVSSRHSWSRGLEEAYKKTRPQFLEGLLDETRADFAYIIPVDSEARVLDLGAGWGTISIALAKHYNHVYAIDACYEKMQFLEIRKAQEAIENITCIFADGFKLPFPDNFFDSVILYGVLEWAGYSRGDVPPVDAELILMREVRRVLKKGGCAYISIENRWGAIYFLGFPDPHTGLPFISIMPRIIANLYSKLMRKGAYSVITHSLGGYRNIMKGAGFSGAEFFTPLPSYRKFYYLVPLADLSVMKFFINNLARAHTRLAKLFLFACRNLRINRLIKYIVSDYAIIAKK